MDNYQVTAAVAVLTMAIIVMFEFTLIAFKKPTYSGLIQAQIKLSPLSFAIGFLLGALLAHWTKW